MSVELCVLMRSVPSAARAVITDVDLMPVVVVVVVVIVDVSVCACVQAGPNAITRVKSF